MEKTRTSQIFHISLIYTNEQCYSKKRNRNNN